MILKNEHKDSRIHQVNVFLIFYIFSFYITRNKNIILILKVSSRGGRSGLKAFLFGHGLDLNFHSRFPLKEGVGAGKAPHYPAR